MTASFDPDLGRISELLGKEPGVGAILLLVENYLRQRQYAAAAEAGRRGVQLYPENLELRMLLGQSLFALNCPAEAEEIFLPIIAEIRYLGQVFDTLAQIYRQRGMLTEAQEAVTLYHLLQEQSLPPGASLTPEPETPLPFCGLEKTRSRAKALQILHKWQQALQTKLSQG